MFKYTDVADGYKMVGNAVPVEFAKHIALKIADDLKNNLMVNRNTSQVNLKQPVLSC
jgi:DNA (cytosine-5)-methyltransferase 1